MRLYEGSLANSLLNITICKRWEELENRKEVHCSNPSVSLDAVNALQLLKALTAFCLSTIGQICKLSIFVILYSVALSYVDVCFTTMDVCVLIKHKILIIRNCIMILHNRFYLNTNTSFTTNAVPEVLMLEDVIILRKISET